MLTAECLYWICSSDPIMNGTIRSRCALGISFGPSMLVVSNRVGPAQLANRKHNNTDMRSCKLNYHPSVIPTASNLREDDAIWVRKLVQKPPKYCGIGANIGFLMTFFGFPRVVTGPSDRLRKWFLWYALDSTRRNP
jgi:hypothetical protein